MTREERFDWFDDIMQCDGAGYKYAVIIFGGYGGPEVFDYLQYDDADIIERMVAGCFAGYGTVAKVGVCKLRKDGRVHRGYTPWYMAVECD